MRYLIVLAAILTLSVAAWAQKVTIRAVNQPAAAVFRSIMEQTGKNFVYSSELLNDMRVSVRVSNKPLDKALKEIFKGTDIEYNIKGKTVVLKKKPRKSRKSDMSTHTPPPAAVMPPEVSDTTIMLDEVVVLSRLEDSEVQTPEIGAVQLTAAQVRNTPTLLGEADVVKTLHTEPGVTEGTEGMAGMNVHGGNTDENLYMLDNVPLYQVNHFAGLFSAFNPEIIRYIDFFKSSVPAKYDGRLSSFLDVRLQNGNTQGHHGSARLGLTAGSFNISGPIGSKTSYLFGLRRSWFDVLTVPFLAVLNSSVEDKIRFCYYFMDLNAQVTHRFSSRATGFVSLYFGDDLLKTGTKDAGFDGDIIGSVENDKYDYHWGNLVARTGLNYRLSESMSAEFTAAYTRYFSNMNSHEIYKNSDPNNELRL